MTQAVESIPAACAHCGLPVFRTRRTADDSADVFCCLGCRLAAAVAAGPDGPRRFLEARLLLSAFLAMGVMEFTLVLYGESAYEPAADAATALLRRMGQIAVSLFAIPVLGLLGVPIVRGAWRDLRNGLVRMDGLIALGTFAAYGLSLYHTIIGAGQVYYETATMVLVLVMLGRRLEAHARSQGRDAARALADSLPKAAHRIEGGGALSDVDPARLVEGDLVQVLPGETVPAEIRILEGSTEVVAAHVSGESHPTLVGPGDRVTAGAINGLGVLTACVERPWKDGPLAQVLALLDAPLPPTRVMRSVDRWASWLAALSVLLAIGGGIRSGVLKGPGEGIRTALSVLLVSCPCALGLATPLAYRAIRTALARRGVLVNDPRALEVTPSIDAVILDKTGTLTVSDAPLRKTASSEAAAFGRMAELVSHSGHALGHKLFRRRALSHSLRVVPGCGVEAIIDGKICRAGRPQWLEASGASWAPALSAERVDLEASGATIVAYSEDDGIHALGTLEQELRPGAADAITRLKRHGVAIEILSGDRAAAVADVAERLGIAGQGEVRPDGKVDRITELHEGGRRVLMAGDGINDAPALRAADVSVAMGSGTAVARSQAQVEILGDDLRSLPLLFEAAAELRRVVFGNLFWTLAYNGVALAFAAAGALHPVVAAAAMVGSSIAVSVRSYRLLGFVKSAA